MYQKVTAIGYSVTVYMKRKKFSKKILFETFVKIGVINLPALIGIHWWYDS